MRLFGLALALGVLLSSRAAEAQPNIIVIMTDDQRDADPLERMPNTESLLAGHGVRFLNSFVVNPICCASRASFLTGQYSHNNGVWDNKWGPRPGGFKAFVHDDNALPVWLKSAGYRTGMIGKYLNGYGKKKWKNYIPPGWDYWWGLTMPYRYYDYEVNDNGTIETYGEGDKNYQADVESQLAQQFIANSAQPFFLWMTGIAPHAGYPGVNVPEPPRRYKGVFNDLKLPKPPDFNERDISDKPRFMRKHVPLMDKSELDLARKSYRRRAETLLAVDDMVGAIVNELETLGMLDNTYIIFTSDNGFFNGEHRVPVDKHLLYEESLRVPLVIRGPGVAEGETRIQMVNNLDLTATVVALAGATAGRPEDGRSLAPLFSSNDVSWRTAMLLEGEDELPNFFDHDLHGYYSAVRTAAYKYAEHVDKKENYAGKEFYDLSADPYELKSRPDARGYRQIVKSLRQLLTDIGACQGDGCWVTTAFSRPPSHRHVPPEIGPICRNCSPLDLSGPSDTAESNSSR